MSRKKKSKRTASQKAMQRQQSSRSARNRKITSGAVAAIVAALALAFGVMAYVFPRQAPPEPAPPPQSRAGEIDLVIGSMATLYPATGMPSASPPAYPAEEAMQHCDDWSSWAFSNGVAPIGNQVDIKVSANVTSPITVTDVRLRRVSTAKMDSRDQVQCTYGAGGELGANLKADLELTQQRLPMDIDADGEPDTTLPGGVFTVDASKSGWLTLYYDGKPGTVYGMSMTVVYTENGMESQKVFGSADAPIFLATYQDDSSSVRKVDWDFAVGRWANAATPGLGE
ncbi:hypothetical protein ACIGG9_26740 [Pseudonocardia alni]|uniref:hypothetical protein n=1 Tax=Pseudonocardia alni TaxID=33907 RepID=UPI0033C0BBB1